VVKFSSLGADGGFVSWSVQRIVEYFGGFELSARRHDGSVAELPPDLVVSTLEVPFLWIDRILHQENLGDLDVAVNWRLALAKPGVGIEFETSLIDEARMMRTSEMRYLNLLDDPRFEAIVVGLRFGAPPTSVCETSEKGRDVQNVTRAPWTLLTMDLVGKILEADGEADAIFGRPTNEVIGAETLSLLHPHDVDAVVLRWVDFVTTQMPVRSIHTRVLRPDGTTLWVNIKLLSRPSEALALALIEDVSSRLESDERLATATASFASLVDLFQHPVFVATSDGRISLANSAFRAKSSQFQSVAEMEGQHHDPLAWKAMCDYGSDYSHLINGSNADGEVSWWRLTCQLADGAGPSVVIGQMFEVTEECRREQMLEDWANQDTMTGLLNRRGLEQRWTQIDLESVAVVFFDINGLKRINDDRGHSVGDFLLREAALRLRASVDPTDVLARIGGDEFVLVTKCSSGDELLRTQMIATIRHALEGPVVCDGHVVELTASIGWYECSSASSLSDALDNADRAMYREKRLHHDVQKTASASVPAREAEARNMPSLPLLAKGGAGSGPSGGATVRTIGYHQ
jgi:diguanylate cyclase (GGDEF)-like protein/PAS domain S-box-containing protein